MKNSMSQPEITLRKILRAKLLSCSPATPISEAASRMVEQKCSSILVEDQGQIVGIWTEQDALAVDLADPDVFRTPIAEAMSAPVKSIDIDTQIGVAALRFRDEKIRHLLVLDESGKHRGIVSQTDIVIHQGLDYYLTLRDVRSVFNQTFFKFPGSTPVRDVIREMQEKRLDAVIVENPGHAYGIVTERDVVRLIGDRKTAAVASEVASFPLILVAASSSLYHARKLFITSRIRHLGVTDDSGQLIGLLTFADILANIESEYVRRLQETLNEREEILAISDRHLRLAAAAFASTFEAIMITDANNVIESVNPAFTMMTGFNAHEVLGKPPSILASDRHGSQIYDAMREQLAANGHWQGEVWNKRPNGEIYVAWLNINVVTDSAANIGNYVAVFSDITNRKAAEERMRFLAHHDALTGLPNRTLLTDRLLRGIALAKRNNNKLAVIFLDLNDFKKINDTLGHHAGDQLLQIVAQRLSNCVRESDTVGRLGGDEFVVLVGAIDKHVDVLVVAEKIVASLAQPMTIEGRIVQVSTSIGISLYPDHGDHPELLLKNSDEAMYQAKADGPNNFHFFDFDAGNQPATAADDSE